MVSVWWCIATESKSDRKQTETDRSREPAKRPLYTPRTAQHTTRATTASGRVEGTDCGAARRGTEKTKRPMARSIDRKQTTNSWK